MTKNSKAVYMGVVLGFVLSAGIAFGQDATTSRKLADAKCGPGAPVSLNSASAEAIADAIPGVGPSTAAAIVAARPFSSWEAYDAVRGIGAAKLEASKRCATLDTAPAKPAAK